jgi:hypothetical protein
VVDRIGGEVRATSIVRDAPGKPILSPVVEPAGKKVIR